MLQPVLRSLLNDIVTSCAVCADCPHFKELDESNVPREGMLNDLLALMRTRTNRMLAALLVTVNLS